MSIDRAKLDTITDKIMDYKLPKPQNGRIPYRSEAQLILHNIDGSIIHQRPMDGYISATELCKKAGKEWNEYWRNKSTQEFLKELSPDTRILVSGDNQSLIIQIQGVGAIEGKGTWVHPDVAIHLAQWLSPKFAVFSFPCSGVGMHRLD